MRVSYEKKKKMLCIDVTCYQTITKQTHLIQSQTRLQQHIIKESQNFVLISAVLSLIVTHIHMYLAAVFLYILAVPSTPSSSNHCLPLITPCCIQSAAASGYLCCHSELLSFLLFCILVPFTTIQYLMSHLKTDNLTD